MGLAKITSGLQTLLSGSLSTQTPGGSLFWLGSLTFTVPPPRHSPLGVQGGPHLRERHITTRHRDREVFSSCLSGHLGTPPPNPNQDLPAWAASSAARVSRRLSLSTLPCPRLSFSLECSSLWEATAAAPDWVEGQGFPILVAASVYPSVNCVCKASGHQRFAPALGVSSVTVSLGGVHAGSRRGRDT